MARIEQGAKAHVESAKPSNPKLRLRTRLMETVNRIFASKEEKLSNQKQMLEGISRRRMLALGAAAIVAACAPLPAAAQETTPKRSPKEPAAVEKSEIEYNIITDASELEPYLENAKNKRISLKEGDLHRFGPYKFWTGTTVNGITDISIGAEGFAGNLTIHIRGPPENISLLALDVGDNNTIIKGKMLVFANTEEVRFIYFDKQKNKYERGIIEIGEGKMRRGPVISGYGMDNDGIFILIAPKDLKPGDVICQAGVWNDGTSGQGWFKFVPKQMPREVAMK